MMFNDEGLGEAMQASYNERLAKDAVAKAKDLQERIEMLEKIIDYLTRSKANK